jgi:phenylacetate-CoA ligase
MRDQGLHDAAPGGSTHPLMLQFLKSVPFVEDLIRRNPLYYAQFRRLLDEVEGMGQAGRSALRDRLTARTLAWSADVPGYGPGGGRTAADYPILTKDMLRDGDYRARRVVAVAASTGGSSGHPLSLSRTPRSVVIEQATIDWLVAKTGIDLARARVAVLRGGVIKDPNDQTAPFWRRAASRRLLLSSYHLSRANFPAFAQELAAFRPDVLLAYPSSLELLTSLAEDSASKLRFAVAMTSSETLRPGLRKRVQATFGAQLLDHYGMAERVAAAYSLEDGSYRFVFPYAAAELIAAGDGTARIVGTGLWNRAQPLIRYDTGDIALLPAGVTPEKLTRITLGLEPFAGIEGRASDVLQLANGARVYALGQILNGVAGIATAQFVQEELDRVQVVVVARGRLPEETLGMIRRNFYKKAPRSIRLDFDLRETPYRLSNGKAPIFISHLPAA